RSPRHAARGATLERRRVAALRQLDDDLVVLSFLAVVTHEARAQPPGLHAHDRIRPRIERLLLAEYLDADDVFLQLIAASGDGLERDEREEPFESIDLLKRRAAEDAVELLPHVLFRKVVRRGDERGLRHPA